MKKRYYFDYAATTPVDSRVAEIMAPYHSDVFGNPSSIHKFGQEASAAVFKARNNIAKLINCDYREIIFTGSATEANNLALRGVVKSVRTAGISGTFLPRIITSSIEHESVLETCRDLEKDGVEVIYLPVSKNGIVDLKKLKAALNENTFLVSIMYANNEIGSIQPIKEIAKIIQEFKVRNVGIVGNDNLEQVKCFNKRALASDRTILTSLYPFLHTDASQAFNYLNCDVKNLGVDMMTLSSQKIYGPKGVGLLYVKNFGNFQGQKFISPVITGGKHEEGLRAGTENVAGIAGFSKAAQIASDSRKKESQRLFKLQDYFLKRIKTVFPKVKLNGPAPGKSRLPNNINVYFPKQKDLIFKLDLAGFAVSAGSACSSRMANPSHVLKTLGCSDEKASESVRISLGRQTDRESIDKLLKSLKNTLKS